LDSNGTVAPERDSLSQRLREERDAGTGWLIEGQPYDDGSGWDWGNLARHDECPDTLPGSYAVDAKFVMAARHKTTGRIRASALKTLHIKNAGELGRLRESCGAEHIDSQMRRMAESAKLREWGGSPDPFGYGSEQSVPGAGAGALGSYLPLWPGPVTRQLYWQDYFSMSAKAFEAYNHDPVSWRCVHLKTEFALGKGLQAKATYSGGSNAGERHDKAHAVWEEFWKRCNMDNRLDMFARDLSWGGEQFFRFFQRGRLLTVRSLDPASIYDLITDPEDHETVFAYHQQFQTPYQLYPPTGAPPTGVPSPMGPTQSGAATKFIIRQILPQEIDHYRINQSAFERRGRSDLFPALGWIRRLRDYLTSHVISADLLSRICWDLEVAGNQAAVQSLRGQLFPNGQAPPPGSVFGHNSASKLTSIAPAHAASGGSRMGDPILDALVTMVSNSIGVPKDWLGFATGSTRAGALVATEPAARSLEELQGTVEGVLHTTFDRVMRAAGISDAEAEFTFPSIASEDRTQKLQDLAYCESMGWISKQTAAAMAMKEMGVTNYDFEQEQGLIADEFPEPEMEDVPDSEPNPVTGKKPQQPVQGDGTVRRSIINATLRQIPKVDITKSPRNEDLPAGLLEDTTTGAPVAGLTPPMGGAPTNGGPPAPGTAPSRAGIPADENPMSGAGAKNIKADNTAHTSEAQPVFTAEQVAFLVRERDRRRRPDDPAFQAASQEYRKDAAKNLAQLVKDAVARSA
jgi:hypothetical protein